MTFESLMTFGLHKDKKSFFCFYLKFSSLCQSYNEFRLWSILGKVLIEALFLKQTYELKNICTRTNTYTHIKHTQTDCIIHIGREYPSWPTPVMTRQMSADLFPWSCTILEKKNIFHLIPNFLVFTTPILGWYITGRKNISHNTLSMCIVY